MKGILRGRHERRRAQRTLKTMMVSVEALEPRTALSGGNVTVQLSGPDWKITGDDNPNAITLTPLSNGAIRVTGGASTGGTTTVNGKTYADFVPSGNVSVTLKDGDDKLMLQGSSSRQLRFPSGLTLSMGRGIDTVVGSYVYAGRTLNVDMGIESQGVGYETAAFNNADVGGVTYRTDRTAGANSFEMSICTVRGDVSITGSNGQNSVSLGSVNVSGSLTASMGSEPNNSTTSDIFSMTSSAVAGRVQLDMGEGRGQATFTRIAADTIDVLFGGSDADQLGFSDSNVRRARFDGGHGNNDRIWGGRNVFREKLDIVRFEKNELR